jgi:hypothetical protein
MLIELSIFGIVVNGKPECGLYKLLMRVLDMEF